MTLRCRTLRSRLTLSSRRLRYCPCRDVGFRLILLPALTDAEAGPNIGGAAAATGPRPAGHAAQKRKWHSGAAVLDRQLGKRDLAPPSASPPSIVTPPTGKALRERRPPCPATEPPPPSPAKR
jgi:hypothetical protein